jgi:integrase/recombinase XerD
VTTHGVSRLTAISDAGSTPAASTITTSFVQESDAYLRDARSRELESSTLSKLEGIFRKQFLTWFRSEGYKFLDEIDLDALLLFRDTWIDGLLAKRKKQERLIGFFWACVRRGYITRQSTFGLGKIKVDQTPSDYFPPHEFDRIVAQRTPITRIAAKSGTPTAHGFAP